MRYSGSSNLVIEGYHFDNPTNVVGFAYAVLSLNECLQEAEIEQLKSEEEDTAAGVEKLLN
jgi:hypothetical protein